MISCFNRVKESFWFVRLSINIIAEPWVHPSTLTCWPSWSGCRAGQTAWTEGGPWCQKLLYCFSPRQLPRLQPGAKEAIWRRPTGGRRSAGRAWPGRRPPVSARPCSPPQDCCDLSRISVKSERWSFWLYSPLYLGSTRCHLQVLNKLLMEVLRPFFVLAVKSWATTLQHNNRIHCKSNWMWRWSTTYRLMTDQMIWTPSTKQNIYTI